MPHNIIMPALGMTQVTGLIVAWHKQPGDAVRADDVLLEVETDKTTMEVEAGHDGFVSAIHAEAGAEVPVGDVIAVLSETRPTGMPPPAGPPPEMARPAAEPEAAPETPSKPAADSAPTTASAAPVRRPPPPSDGRILASPKARRLARERGLDLGLLVAQGVPQPYHVADLDVLAALPTAQMPARNSHLAISAQESGFADFMSWLSEETGGGVGRPAVLAAFAAASLRATTGFARPDIAIRTETLASGGGDASFENPDQGGLAQVRTTGGQAAPDIVVRDLTTTRMTAMRLGDDAVPVLTVARSTAAAAYEITLDFAAQGLPATDAVALIEGFAQRIETPLHQLL
jgi:pyruvate/2-oxoglutarate dehydrogenase complex dihydrolipoamide acyltransferase (E2) component